MEKNCLINFFVYINILLIIMNKDNILEKSLEKAFKGGIAGSTAMVLQVCSLMWLRTTMNYQYRYGGTLGSSLKELYGDGVVYMYPL